MNCYNCFYEYEGTVCPRCGYDAAAAAGLYPLALRPGSILGGRYIVGRVLGEGGFGITYIAQDYNTKQLVAIKEHFPSSLVTRTERVTVSLISEGMREAFQEGKEKFLEEAKTLSQFNGLENICEIYSYFEENGTAYFAMEYVHGMPLDACLKKRGRLLSFDEALELMLPVMEALGHVHERGIIHRDISPDNIMIRPEGGAMLIDFGAARYSMGEKSRSLDVILKHGFAPKEQYTRRGRQGAYTDVYAMAATFYYAITGKVPPEAIDRIDKDELVPPSKLGIKIPHKAEQALMKALAVDYRQRIQSMKEFAGAIAAKKPRKAKQEKTPAEKPKKEKKKGRGRKLAAMLAVAAVAVVAFGLWQMYAGLIAYGRSGALSWRIQDDGALVISGKGPMENYSYSKRAPWYDYRAEIESLVIKEGVSTIGDCAFQKCEKLEQLSLPTGLEKIGKYAFSDCKSLRKLEIPEGVTSYGDYAFDDCWALQSVSIPGSVKEMGQYGFNGCSRLREVILQPGIRSVGERAFISCKGLESVEIPEGTSSVGKYAFHGCSKLSDVYLPSSLKNIYERAFESCYSLQEIYLPISLERLGSYAFADCVQLRELAVPGRVKDIFTGAFYNCSALEKAYIPESVKNIGDLAFQNCENLEYIYYAGSWEKWQNVSLGENCIDTRRTYLRYDTPAEFAVLVPRRAGDISWELSEDGVLRLSGSGAMDDYKNNFSAPWSSKGARIKAVIVEEGITHIGTRAFMNFSKLESVSLPKSLVSVGRYAFYNFSSLEKVEYAGSEASWNKIVIDSDNAQLLEAEIIYNSK